MEGGWCNREVREGYEVGLWKEIRKEGPLMFKNIVYSVGDGGRAFWKDKWCGNNTLCDSFPSLYALANSKEVWVAAVGTCWRKRGVGIPGSLNLSMIGRWRWWRGSFLTLQGKRLVIDLEDRVLWKETKDGKFYVKSLYSALETRSAVSILKNIIWSPCVPTKVGFFTWEALWGKVLTLDQLKRRG